MNITLSIAQLISLIAGILMLAAFAELHRRDVFDYFRTARTVRRREL